MVYAPREDVDGGWEHWERTENPMPHTPIAQAEYRADLDALCERWSCSESEAIRRAVREAVERGRAADDAADRAVDGLQ